MASFRSRLKRKRRVGVRTRNTFRRGISQRRRHARIYRRASRNYRRTGLNLLGAVRPTPAAPNRITTGTLGTNKRLPDKLYTKFPFWWYTDFKVPAAFPTGQTFVGMQWKANALNNIAYYTRSSMIAWNPTYWTIPNLSKMAIDYTKYKVLASKITVNIWNKGSSDYMVIVFPSDQSYSWQAASIQNLKMSYFLALPNAKYKMVLANSIPRKNVIKISNYMSSKKIMEEKDYADDVDIQGSILPIATDGTANSGPSAARTWFWNVVYFRMDEAALTASNSPFVGTIRIKPYVELHDIKPVFQSGDEQVLAESAPIAEGT